MKLKYRIILNNKKSSQKIHKNEIKMQNQKKNYKKISKMKTEEKNSLKATKP